MKMKRITGDKVQITVTTKELESLSLIMSEFWEQFSSVIWKTERAVITRFFRERGRLNITDLAE